MHLPLVSKPTPGFRYESTMVSLKLGWDEILELLGNQLSWNGWGIQKFAKTQGWGPFLNQSFWNWLADFERLHCSGSVEIRARLESWCTTLRAFGWWVVIFHLERGTFDIPLASSGLSGWSKYHEISEFDQMNPWMWMVKPFFSCHEVELVKRKQSSPQNSSTPNAKQLYPVPARSSLRPAP